ncbi:MAG: RNA polymerase sigma-70 factor [Cyclobacteriaceae bacterium]
MTRLNIADLTSFESLFRAYYSNMVIYAFKFLRKKEEAEDLVQEVFFSLWKKKDTIELKSSLESYLFGAVKRQCQNKLRHDKVVRKYANNFAISSNQSQDPYSTLVGEEMESVIKNTLDELPDQSKKIFVMNRFESKKYKEIAKELSISVKTVEAHMSKVLKLFRMKLSQYQASIVLLITMIIGK